MRCPLDDTKLREVNRRGVEIDICPECKGVWLDRGELEKLLVVAEQEETAAYESRGSRRRDDDDDDRRRGSSFGSSGDSFGSSGDRTRGRGSFFGGSGDSFGSSGDRTRGRCAWPILTVTGAVDTCSRKEEKLVLPDDGERRRRGRRLARRLPLESASPGREDPPRIPRHGNERNRSGYLPHPRAPRRRHRP